MLAHTPIIHSERVPRKFGQKTSNWHWVIWVCHVFVAFNTPLIGRFLVFLLRASSPKSVIEQNIAVSSQRVFCNGSQNTAN